MGIAEKYGGGDGVMVSDATASDKWFESVESGKKQGFLT